MADVRAGTAHPEADFIVSIFMERIYGIDAWRRSSRVFVLWTAFGSVFALLLGYSRIPYAAALDGTFFRVFGRVHAQKRFPHVSLLVIGGLSILASAVPLGIVIASLITTRILIQFIGQIVVVIRLRRTQPDGAAPLPHVALSGAGAGRARGLDLRVRHVRRQGDRLRPGHARRRRRRVSGLAARKSHRRVRRVTNSASPGSVGASARPLANPGPILVVVTIGAIALIVAIASILRRPAVPAVISEDYTRVAGRLLVPEVRGADPDAVARGLNARQPSFVVRLPSFGDAGYTLEGGAIRHDVQRARRRRDLSQSRAGPARGSRVSRRALGAARPARNAAGERAPVRDSAEVHAHPRLLAGRTARDGGHVELSPSSR